MATPPSPSIAGLLAGLRADGTGPLALELGRVTVHDFVARWRMEAGALRLDDVTAGRFEVSGMKLPAPSAGGPASTGAQEAPTRWSLGPLASAEGTLEAEIVDATLLFDADVKVPIRQGRVDFNEATVAHVGPDSRMGVSRLGIYVDAPNGRSYLYQFPATPVDGVEFERQSVLPGPWNTKRGGLQLQPFTEWLLRQAAGASKHGITEQARQLLARTAVKGFLQLADGLVTGPGAQVQFAEQAAGRNTVRVTSQAVGRGLEVDVASLSLRDARWTAGGIEAACATITGALVLQVLAEGTGWRVEARMPKMDLQELRLRMAALSPP